MCCLHGRVSSEGWSKWQTWTGSGFLILPAEGAAEQGRPPWTGGGESQSYAKHLAKRCDPFISVAIATDSAVAITAITAIISTVAITFTVTIILLLLFRMIKQGQILAVPTIVGNFCQISFLLFSDL